MCRVNAFDLGHFNVLGENGGRMASTKLVSRTADRWLKVR